MKDLAKVIVEALGVYSHRIDFLRRSVFTGLEAAGLSRRVACRLSHVLFKDGDQPNERFIRAWRHSGPPYSAPVLDWATDKSCWYFG